MILTINYILTVLLNLSTSFLSAKLIVSPFFIGRIVHCEQRDLLNTEIR